MYQEQQHKTLLQLGHAVGKLGALAQGSTVSLQEELQKIEAKESSEKESAMNDSDKSRADKMALYCKMPKIVGNVILESEMAAIRQSSSSAQADAGRFSAVPSDFLLSYGTHEDFSNGLEALVGPPVANAADLARAVQDEHSRDPGFVVSRKKGAFKYTVIPLQEFLYCSGVAQKGGPSYYLQAIQQSQIGDKEGFMKEEKRDADQDNMTVEAFMQNYVVKLVGLMSTVHVGNMDLFQSGSEPYLGFESQWEQIQTMCGKLAGCVSPGLQDAYDTGYNTMNQLLVGYNKLVKQQQSTHQNLQSMVVNDLQRLEVVCIRLYSGPTFKSYNDTSRNQVKGKYSTTIALLASGLIKLSKITKACKVFRGISGGQLPDSFYKPNIFNVKGGIERGFMSTTTVLNEAAKFLKEGRIGVVYEMNMGMIDRGADVSVMSQYPHQREMLFAPLTGLEVQETTRKGNVLYISTRLNINLKIQTIEEMQSKMKNIHLNLVGIVQEDLESKGITELALLDKHKEMAGQEAPLLFNDAMYYLDMTQVPDCCLLCVWTHAAL